MIDTSKCYVCNYDKHDRTDHVYTTWDEAEAWHAAQPQGEPIWPVIDGQPLGGDL